MGLINRNQVNNFSFGEAEVLTDEIEEESLMVGEILRIKEILHKSKEEIDSVLFESLRRLQPLALSVDLLKETDGKAVNPLKKHGSKEIRQLARTLIDGWKAMVDEWIKSSEAIEVVDKEEGLHSPPLDDGALLEAKQSKCHQTKKNEIAIRHTKPKSCLPQKSNTGPKMQQRQETSAVLRRPLVSDDVSAQAKLEATKRKLHDSYQRAANAKKQRTIRVMELHDLPKPKQGNIGHRNPHSKLWKLLGRRR